MDTCFKILALISHVRKLDGCWRWSLWCGGDAEPGQFLLGEFDQQKAQSSTEWRMFFQMGFKANDHSLRCFAALLQLARSHRVLISGTLREDGSGGLALVCFGSCVGGSRDVINLGQFWGSSHHDLSKDDGRQEKPYQNDFCWGFSFFVHRQWMDVNDNDTSSIVIPYTQQRRMGVSGYLTWGSTGMDHRWASRRTLPKTLRCSWLFGEHNPNSWASCEISYMLGRNEIAHWTTSQPTNPGLRFPILRIDFTNVYWTYIMSHSQGPTPQFVGHCFIAWFMKWILRLGSSQGTFLRTGRIWRQIETIKNW